MTVLALPHAISRRVQLAPDWWIAGAVVLAVVLGAAAAVAPLICAAGIAALCAVALIALRPATAGYLMIGLTPLLAGIDRGRLLPVFRPNEALLALCGGALVLRGLLLARAGGLRLPRPGPIALTLTAMAVCNSVIPLMWMAVRNVAITSDDVLYALVLWKFLILYAVVRYSIRQPQQIRRAIWILMAVSVLVAVIGILQSLKLFGVPRLLATWYLASSTDSADALANNRGSSTLALPAATADLMIECLGLAVALWVRERRARRFVAPLATVFIFGAIASGQFSGAIGLVVAVVTLALVMRKPRFLLVFVPIGLIASVVLAPVIQNRLQGFSTASGLPVSWAGRLRNLRSYFWPELMSHQNYLLGVRPGARVPGPRSLGIQWVWIESGYTWLLWGGGLPLLASFIAFVVVSLRVTGRLARTPTPAGAVATSAFVVLVVWTVLMLFDPHMTYRGSGDILYCLLAMVAGALGAAADTGPARPLEQAADPGGARLPGERADLGGGREIEAETPSLTG